jgi:hypothetical protein
MKRLHHSLTDWDYSTPAPYVTEAQFVSSPTSLAARYEPPFNRQGWAMCNLADTLCLPQGRLVTWYRAPGYHPVSFLFRSQFNPSEEKNDPFYNAYEVKIQTSVWMIYRYENGVLTGLGEGNIPNPFNLNEWAHLRVTWYNWQFGIGESLLRIIIEEEVDGEWVQQAYVDDDANLFAESEDNRVGFQVIHANLAEPTCIDDSEVWEPEG